VKVRVEVRVRKARRKNRNLEDAGDAEMRKQERKGEGTLG